MAQASLQAFNAKAIGWFFIAATVSAIVGLNLYAPLLTATNFVEAASHHRTRIVCGALNELVLVVAATGTGILLYPVLKRCHEGLAIGYLSFRILEVVLIVLGMVSVLGALSVSQLYLNGVIEGKSAAQNLMLGFMGIHKWAFILGPNFMLSLNTFIYSTVFYKTGFIPKPLAILGLLASVLIMAAAVLEMFGVIEQRSWWGVLLALPIALYEMILAGWLLVKGFQFQGEQAPYPVLATCPREGISSMVTTQ